MQSEALGGCVDVSHLDDHLHDQHAINLGLPVNTPSLLRAHLEREGGREGGGGEEGRRGGEREERGGREGKRGRKGGWKGKCVFTHHRHNKPGLTLALKVERMSKCILRSVARMPSMMRKRSLFSSASSRETRKLFSSKLVSRCQLAAA